jgi:DNA-binding HxlR family transcriptional regulator
MHWDDVGSQVCSIARTMSILGDRWTLLVVREAFVDTKTFDEFVACTGATPQVVSARLKRLVEAGVLEKKPVAGCKGRSEYVLTEMGHDLHPIICTIMVWGDKWLSGGKGRPLVLRHTGCGCATSPKLACDACGEFVSRKTLKGEPSPAMKRYRARMISEVSV